MARDAQGNDLGAIDVQLTGFAAVNFNATQAPSLIELALYTIPTGYEYIGLFLEDGGYAEETEAGDLTYFFQQGYSLRTGDQSITGKLVPAEDNDTVWKLTGIDANVRKDIAYNESFGLIIATQFKNGNIVARGGMAHVTEVAPSAESRGEINSIEITFEWEYSTIIDGYYNILRKGTGLEQIDLYDVPFTFQNGVTSTGDGGLAIFTIPCSQNIANVRAISTTYQPCTPGDVIIASTNVKKTNPATGRFALSVYFYNGTTFVSAVDVHTLKAEELTTSYVTIDGVATVPDGVDSFRVCVRRSYTSSDAEASGSFQAARVRAYLQPKR